MNQSNNKESNRTKSGGAHLQMNDKYRKKHNCLKKARALLDKGKVTGMTELEIGKEIFAHAVAYYAAPKLSQIPKVGERIRDYLMDHAKVIDIEDGGDKFPLKVIYDAIWVCLGSEFRP